MSEEQKPEAQEKPVYPRPIMNVVLLENGEIQMARFSKHIPSLCHILKMLDYEITEMMAQEKTLREMKDAPKIKVNSFTQLKGFLSRRKHAG